MPIEGDVIPDAFDLLDLVDWGVQAMKGADPGLVDAEAIAWGEKFTAALLEWLRRNRRPDAIPPHEAAEPLVDRN
jgi:hypothetical protein